MGLDDARWYPGLFHQSSAAAQSGLAAAAQAQSNFSKMYGTTMFNSNTKIEKYKILPKGLAFDSYEAYNYTNYDLSNTKINNCYALDNEGRFVSSTWSEIIQYEKKAKKT